MSALGLVSLLASPFREFIDSVVRKNYEEGLPSGGAISTLPNAITLLRLLLVVPAASAILAGRHGAVLRLALLFFVLDNLDGYLAKKFHQQTRFGAAFDRIVDAVGTLVGMLCFTFVGRIPVWLLGLLVGKQTWQIAIGAWLTRRALPYPAVYLVQGRFGFGTATAAVALAAALVSAPTVKLALLVVTAALLGGSVVVLTARSVELLRAAK